MREAEGLLALLKKLGQGALEEVVVAEQSNPAWQSSGTGQGCFEREVLGAALIGGAGGGRCISLHSVTQCLR